MILTKIEKLALKVYGAGEVEYSKEAEKSIKLIEKNNFSKLPVCVAKTQYSLSDDKNLIGAPSGFKITVRDVEIRSGAGFLVVLLGEMLLMPGLGKNPAACKMKIDENEVIEGLF